MNIKKNISINTSDKYLERQRIEEELEKNAAMLIQHQKLQRIDSFTGYFEFLLNNYLSPVYFEGSLYPSVTHAYHAARSSDDNTRKAILNADSFHTVAQIARRIVDPSIWPMKRLKIMEQLVRDKFRRSKELQEKLKATEKRELIMTYEDETQGNLFWGVAKNKGQNQLGRILMKIREDIFNNKEIINWITSNFELINEPQFLPEISLTVNKENKQIDHIVLRNKSFYKFGLLNDSDVPLAHPSISRLHAVIICDKNLGVILIDLRSKAGTKLDNDIIKDHIPYRLKEGKKINFALSTRDYIISIDLSKVKKVYEREKIKLQDELKILNELKGEEDMFKKGEVLKKTFGIDRNHESDTIFLSHIPKEAIENDIVKLLEDQFGELKNISWPNDKETGFKKPFAFVQFKSIDSAREAVEYGLISYDLSEENANEDYFNLDENKERSVMLKIKFADKDKIRNPPFERRGVDFRNKNVEYSKKDIEKDMEKDYNKHKINERKILKENIKTKYNHDSNRSKNVKNEKIKKSRKDDTSSSESESDSNSNDSSDYYSSSSSESSFESGPSDSNSSSSSTEKIKKYSKLKKRKISKSRSRSRSRSRSHSRSHHKRRNK